MQRKILVLATLACLAGVGSSQGAVLSPTSYDMLNGQSGLYKYHDDSYHLGTGNNQQDLAPLSGGLGDLTDGFIATESWFYTEGEQGPYVGWQERDTKITFHFGESVNVGKVVLHVDYLWGIGPPESVSVSMGGVSAPTLSVDNPPGKGPFAITLDNLDLTGESLVLEMFVQDDPSRYDWVFLSEVEFESAHSPEPTTFVIWSLLGTLGIVVGWRRRRRAA